MTQQTTEAFMVSGNRIFPGEGWNEFARIYRDKSAVKTLGQMVGFTGFALTEGDFYLAGVARDFEAATKPPFSPAERSQLTQGLFLAHDQGNQDRSIAG